MARWRVDFIGKVLCTLGAVEAGTRRTRQGTSSQRPRPRDKCCFDQSR
jgi:hypothetical protein